LALDAYEAWLSDTGLDNVLKLARGYQTSEDAEKGLVYKFEMSTSLLPVEWIDFLYGLDDRGVSPEKVEQMLLFKMAHLLHIPAHRVSIYIGGNCFYQTISIGKDGAFESDGISCMTGASSVTIDPNNIDMSYLQTQSDVTLDYSQAVKDAVKDYVKTKHFLRPNSRIQAVVEEGYLEYIVRGLKDEVIPGEGLWEKLQLSLIIVSNTEKTELTIVLILDGQIASGILEPIDAAFTDMQPQYSEYLHNYASEFLTKLKTSLAQNNKP
jgi:hypothetical protein